MQRALDAGAEFLLLGDLDIDLAAPVHLRRAFIRRAIPVILRARRQAQAAARQGALLHQPGRIERERQCLQPIAHDQVERADVGQRQHGGRAAIAFARRFRPARHMIGQLAKAALTHHAAALDRDIEAGKGMRPRGGGGKHRVDEVKAAVLFAFLARRRLDHLRQRFAAEFLHCLARRQAEAAQHRVDGALRVLVDDIFGDRHALKGEAVEAEPGERLFLRQQVGGADRDKVEEAFMHGGIEVGGGEFLQQRVSRRHPPVAHAAVIVEPAGTEGQPGPVARRHRALQPGGQFLRRLPRRRIVKMRGTLRAGRRLHRDIGAARQREFQHLLPMRFPGRALRFQRIPAPHDGIGIGRSGGRGDVGHRTSFG